MGVSQIAGGLISWKTELIYQRQRGTFPWQIEIYTSESLGSGQSSATELCDVTLMRPRSENGDLMRRSVGISNLRIFFPGKPPPIGYDSSVSGFAELLIPKPWENHGESFIFPGEISSFLG